MPDSGAERARDRTGRACSDEEIARQIARLSSLLEGERAAAALVACGPSAVPALRRFLLEGRPSSLPQPRRRAVEALGGLGAKEVLVDYLLHPRAIADAVVRFSEEEVESAAACELAGWQTDDVFQTLLAVAADRLLPGVIAALARFHRPEAVLYLVNALEDDFCRDAAEQGLRELGGLARAALIAAAGTRRPSGAEESATSLRRRRSALGVLREVGADDRDRAWVRAMLTDPTETDPALLVRVAELVSQVGREDDRRAAIDRLRAIVPHAPWDVQEEIEDALTRLSNPSSGD